MKDCVMKDTTRDEWRAISSMSADRESVHQRLALIRGAEERPSDARAASYVSISVDTDGHIDFESEVVPEHAEQMTDALLMMLIKAREARR
jgi:hypothetical protein